MLLIDSNALVVLIIGLIDTNLLSNHKRTSIYDEDDFLDLLGFISNIERLVVIPNVWTEVDNLLNDFSGNYKYPYLTHLTDTIKGTTELFLSSEIATSSPFFPELGLTDSLLIHYGVSCEFLITSDSKLSDHAIANGIEVYDLVKIKNLKLQRS